MLWYIRNRIKKDIKESNVLSSKYVSSLLTGTLCGCHGYCHLHAISKQLARSNFTYYFQYFEAHHFLLCAKCMKQGNCLKFMCEKKDKWVDPDSDPPQHIESFRNRCYTSFNLAALLNNCAKVLFSWYFETIIRPTEADVLNMWLADYFNQLCLHEELDV